MDEAHLWQLLDHHLVAAAELRRAVHREPELSGDESGTRDRVLEALPAGVRVTKVADTGAVVRIGGQGPAVGIRGELDALPVDEGTGVEWASIRPGISHACGHDVHLAALVAVARAVDEARLPTPLLAVLQPREETYPSGARDITQDPVLQEEGLAAMVGAHVQPNLPAGVVACVPGGVNASSDEFEVVVHGTSGHAAYPHLIADSVVALAQVVVALQSIVSRAVDPMSSAVVGVSSMAAGKAANVVPGHARATGTIRAMTEETRALVQHKVRSISTHVAAAHGCKAEVTITNGEPVLRNDPRLVGQVLQQLAAQRIPVSSTLRSLGSDDFSYYSEVVPSVMLFVGSDSARPLHSSSFLPSDADVRRTARAMLAGFLGAAHLIQGDHT